MIRVFTVSQTKQNQNPCQNLVQETIIKPVLEEASMKQLKTSERRNTSKQVFNPLIVCSIMKIDSSPSEY